MKRCSKCKEIKAKSEFHRNRNHGDGLRSQCKKCRYHYQQSAKGKATARRYRQSEKCKAKQRIYQQSPEYKIYQKQYRQSNTGKAARNRHERSNKRKTTRKHCDSLRNYPNRRKARNAINHAVAAGKLPRISTQICGCDDPANHYHHHSYKPKFWLDVEAVRRKCHTKIHHS